MLSPHAIDLTKLTDEWYVVADVLAWFARPLTDDAIAAVIKQAKRSGWLVTDVRLAEFATLRNPKFAMRRAWLAGDREEVARLERLGVKPLV